MAESKEIAKQSAVAGPAIAPVLDILASDKEYLVLANLPGVATEALSLSTEQGELSLTAEREAPLRGASRYARKLRLPDDVDVTGIEAKLDNGVLTLHLPRRQTASPREISVRSS
ncbi:MAG: Hsp20/alpha crystallin family protein [Myxococcales bacterium FL481]|nr:MAG: Hsp20/alpha crystallin family protein [Myxococcales bacterium FL481]